MKLGIVDDRSSALEALRRAITEHSQHTIEWTAATGEEAVAKCANFTPDLVLMNLLMPGMNGSEATRQIMTQTPCAVLIVTASVSANSSLVFEAMGYGAIDAVDFPASTQGRNAGPAALLDKITLIERLIAGRPTLATRDDQRTMSNGGLLAIGASAGGPAAVAKVLGELPADFPAAIVVVQHIDAQFATGMADWLSRSATWPVSVAQAGDRPVSGTTFLAGTNEHLVLNPGGRLSYTHEPVANSNSPSVDVFFESLIETWSGKVVGVLLTGMGRDGALGLKALRLHGHHTIAQNRATSAVYGMPKAAAEIDAAVDILALDQIAPRLIELFSHTTRRNL